MGLRSRRRHPHRRRPCVPAAGQARRRRPDPHRPRCRLQRRADMTAGRRTLGAQIALVTTLVAVVAIAISFVVSASLVRGAAETQARTTLGHYADLVADNAASPGAAAGGPRGGGVRALARLATI